MQKKLLILSLAFCSAAAFAKPFESSIAASFTAGDSLDKSGYQVENDALMLGLDLAYQYHFNENWGLELGYKTLDPDPVTDIFSDILRNVIVLDDVHSVRLAGQYTAQLTERNQLVFSLGAQRYDINYRIRDYDLRTILRYSKNGVSYYGRAGWRYQFDGGFFTGLSYDYQDTDVLDLRSWNLSIGFSF